MLLLSPLLLPVLVPQTQEALEATTAAAAAAAASAAAVATRAEALRGNGSGDGSGVGGSTVAICGFVVRLERRQAANRPRTGWATDRPAVVRRSKQADRQTYIPFPFVASPFSYNNVYRGRAR